MEKAVVAAAGKSHRDLGGFLPDAVQLSLLAGEQGEVSVDTIRQVRGRGRPEGAGNRRNKKIAQYIVQKYGDPLDALANMAFMPLSHLVSVIREADLGEGDEELDRIERIIAQLGHALDKKTAERLAARLLRYLSTKKISAMDVALMQSATLRDLMTYVHGRQPLSVEVSGKTDAFIIIPGLNAPADVPMEQLEDALNQRGMDAIDFEQMKLIDVAEGEFTPVADDDDGEDEDGS